MQLQAANQSVCTSSLFPWKWLPCLWIVRRNPFRHGGPYNQLGWTETQDPLVTAVTQHFYPKYLCAETLLCNNQVSKIYGGSTWLKSTNGEDSFILCPCFQLKLHVKKISKVRNLSISDLTFLLMKSLTVLLLKSFFTIKEKVNNIVP